MVLPSHQLEAARVILGLKHNLVGDLGGLAVYCEIEISLTDNLLLTITDHVDLEL